MAPDDVTGEEGQRNPPEAFRDDLERIGVLLQGAGRGDVDPADIKRALETYWRDHEPALRAGASALTDDVRLQTIAELHKWRDQLAAQREVLESTLPPQREVFESTLPPVAGPDDDLDALVSTQVSRPGTAQEGRQPAPSGELGGSSLPESNGHGTTARRVYQDFRPPQDKPKAPVCDKCDEPDVLRDVPLLKVDELKLDVERLRAHVALLAEVADLLRLSVGADVDIDQAQLTMKGIEAQALLKVRLDEVRAILVKALTTIGDNPEILDVGRRLEDRTHDERGGAVEQTAYQVLPGLADQGEHLLEETVDEAERTLPRDVEDSGSVAQRTTPLPRWDRRHRRPS